MVLYIRQISITSFVLVTFSIHVVVLEVGKNDSQITANRVSTEVFYIICNSQNCLQGFKNNNVWKNLQLTWCYFAAHHHQPVSVAPPFSSIFQVLQANHVNLLQQQQHFKENGNSPSWNQLAFSISELATSMQLATRKISATLNSQLAVYVQLATRTL